MDISFIYSIYQRYPSVQTDTRTLKSGDIFFALKGDNFNGNEFVQQAFDAGAVYAIIDDNNCSINDKCIVVDNVLHTLQQLALFHRRHLDIPFIAITGSNGKTTTKELITAVLCTQYHTAATEGNLNNHIGVPLTVLKIKKDAELAIIEMGANHLREIAAYCKISLPTHGIITNCGKAHIEGFGSEENVKKAKGELYDFLRENEGTIFRNADLVYLKEMAAGIEKQITYGRQEANYEGEPETQDILLSVKYLYDSKPVKIATQLVGVYNFANIMAAIAVGSHFNIPLEKIKAAIETYQPDNSRSQWIKKGSNQVILDAYNANPTSMKAAIQNFAELAIPDKILWVGAMKEMGKEEKQEHEKLIALIEKGDWNDVILVGYEFEKMQHPFTWFANSEEAAAHVKRHPPQTATILIKGSRGSKMELMFEALS